MSLSDVEGKAAVALARESLETKVRGEPGRPKKTTGGSFSKNRGVFVTLNLADPMKERLRGCIGFPLPVMSLGEAIVRATEAAATEDPRFPPVREQELDEIVVEVSVLTLPKEINSKPRDKLPSLVKIGEDGLIISEGSQSGLLLPQVATEFGMDQVEFLSQACMKAGLPPDSWLYPDTRVQVFQAQIFAEKSPRGQVVNVELHES